MSAKKNDAASIDPNNYVRRGYWIEKTVDKAIKFMAISEELKDYEVVNLVLKRGIPKKYFDAVDVVE